MDRALAVLVLTASAAAVQSEVLHSTWEEAYAARTHWTSRDPASKYKPGLPPSGSGAAWPQDVKGIFFSGVFTDHAVLQRAPLASAVYGVVIGATAGTKVSVDLVPVTADRVGTAATIAASVTLDPKFGAGYARWKAVLPPSPAGGNYTITASSPDFSNQTSIHDITFGDVWFCSGQSNMWLPMHMDTSRNRTYDKILAGKYKNIRLRSVAHNNQPDGGIFNTDLDIAPPVPRHQAWGGDAGGGWLLPDVGTYANATCRAGGGDHGCSDPTHCCTGYQQPDDDWLFNTVDTFSATCWHFAEYLTDQMELNNETVIPLGLVSSQWGGTMVEHWIPNATLNAGACKNNSGMPYEPSQNRRWDIDSGALFNGMVRPWVNYSIKGALWYQGENNVFQCHSAADPKSQDKGGKGGGPAACGQVSDNTGYACMMKLLVDQWRSQWGQGQFPFGIVSLAGGTSEGHGRNMGAFRWAQTGNTGVLPNKDMPNTFSAQAYDIGDPCSGGGQCCVNDKEAQGGWPCEAGSAPYTGQFMGGIHPRIKKLVGERLAKAARALVYGDDETVWTGPVLESCTIDSNSRRLVLNFNRDKLRQDTIMVLPDVSRTISMTDTDGANWDPALLPLLAALGPQSPLEIQVNGSGSGTDMTDGIWLPARLQQKCMHSGGDHPGAASQGCNWNYTTGQKTDGWDQVIVAINTDLLSAMGGITGVRYAWGENPCCPGVNRQVVPCPPASCPIQTWNSSLPAVPFWATIKDGKCDWISTTGGGD